jgi:hypothetical protein
MNEAEFWPRLEFRLCREFSGLSERRHQYLWCDGFAPTQYLPDDPQPRIIGKAWICNGPRQTEWDFTLLLPRTFGSRDEIDWASLLPPEKETRWMAFDEARRYIDIEPAVSASDFA